MFKKKEKINPNAINSPLEEYPERNPKIPTSQTPNPLPPPMPRNCIIEGSGIKGCGNPNLPTFRNPPPPPRTVIQDNDGSVGMHVDKVEIRPESKPRTNPNIAPEGISFFGMLMEVISEAI